MMRLAVLVLAALVAFSSTASAQKKLSIAHFYGTFSGGGVAENEDSLYFAVTARDFDVVIGPAGNGFKVTWTSVIRGYGLPPGELPRDVQGRVGSQDRIRGSDTGVARRSIAGSPVTSRSASEKTCPPYGA